jgi:hypothetical protein
MIKHLEKSYPAFANEKEIIVLSMEDEVHKNAIELGSIKIFDRGSSVNCNYDNIILKAKLVAKEWGGNIIKITSHDTPDMSSSCDRIEAVICRLESEVDLIEQKNKIIAPSSNSINYATIYIYRPKGLGWLIGYRIHLGDSAIGKIKNNSAFEVNINKLGLNTIWAATEKKEELSIDLKAGSVYYIKCGLRQGIFIGRPKMQFIDTKYGKKQYEKISMRR